MQYLFTYSHCMNCLAIFFGVSMFMLLLYRINLSHDEENFFWKYFNRRAIYGGSLF